MPAMTDNEIISRVPTILGRQLEATGQLQSLDSPNWLWTQSGTASINFDLPPQAVSLIRLEW
jgi:hypothetical protein